MADGVSSIENAEERREMVRFLVMKSRFAVQFSLRRNSKSSTGTRTWWLGNSNGFGLSVEKAMNQFAMTVQIWINLESLDTTKVQWTWRRRSTYGGSR
jgi:hypothetical protein